MNSYFIYCIRNRYINQTMTKKPFSALLFSTTQYQIDIKDLHLSYSSSLAWVQDWNIFTQVLTFYYFHRLHCLRGTKPWLEVTLILFGRERGSMFVHTDFKFLFVVRISHTHYVPTCGGKKTKRGFPLDRVKL